jgi:hypothetical protein
MPRDGTFVFGDLEGKPEVLQVACTQCERRGQYPVAKLIDRHGREAKLVDWKDTITADCLQRAKSSVAALDQCGAHFPTITADRV